MSNNHLSNFLGGGFWQISSHTVQVFDVETALFIHNLWDWRMKLKEDGLLGDDDFFYLLQDDIQKRTGISVDKQRHFISILGPAKMIDKIDKQGNKFQVKEGIGILEIDRRGMPAKNFYRMDTEKLVKYIEDQISGSQSPQKPISRSSKTPHLDTVKHSVTNNSNSKNIKEPFSNEKDRCLENTDGSLMEIPSQREEYSIKDPTVNIQHDLPETINGKPSIVAIIAKNGKHHISVEQPIRKLNRPPKSPSTKISVSKAQVPSLSERASTGIKQTCNKKAKAPKPKEQPLQIKDKEEDIKILIEHWNELGFKIHNPDKATVSYNKDIRALRKIKEGSLITGEKRKFNPEDIKTSMDRFALLIFNGEYGPDQPMKDHFSKINLCDFLYNPYMKTKSWFLKCYNETPKKNINPNLTEDLHPNIKNKLVGFYYDYALAGLKKRLSEAEENKFREAANKICVLYDQNKERFAGVNGYHEMADMLCQSIYQSYGKRTTMVHPGSFCSSNAMAGMIKFMNEKGCIPDADSLIEFR